MDSRSNKPVQSLRLAQAVALLEQWGLSKEAYNYVEVERDDEAGSDHSSAMNSYSSMYASFAAKKKDAITDGVEEGKLDDEKNVVVDHAVGQPLHPVESNFIDMMSNSAVSAFVRLLAKCVYSLTGGVRRAHLVPTDRGAILKELFTRDGAGRPTAITLLCI